MQNPKVSVIVPIYNKEFFLEKSIFSILEQTEENIEIILVDDGSTDNSFIIMNSFMEEDDRIHVFQKENGGIASAYRYALTYVVGDYVLFVDSDDYVEHNLLSRVNDAIVREDADIIQYAMASEDGQGNVLGYISSDNMVLVGSSTILTEYFNTIRMPSLAMRAIKKELFDSVEIHGRNIGVDEATTIQLLGKCNKMVCIDKILYHIYIRKSSVSRKYMDTAQAHEYLEVHRYICGYIEKYFSELTVYANIKFYKGIMHVFSKHNKHITVSCSEYKYLVTEARRVFNKIRDNHVYKKQALHYRIDAYLFFLIPKIYSGIRRLLLSNKGRM